MVRIRRDSVGEEEISRVLDYITLESIRRKSELTEEEDAAALADEFDRAVWERVAHLFEDGRS